MHSLDSSVVGPLRVRGRGEAAFTWTRRLVDRIRTRRLPDLAWLALAALCSCGGGGGGGSTNPGGTTFGQSFGIVVDASIPLNGTSSQSSLQLAGHVVKTGSSKLPKSLKATVVHASGMKSKALPIAADGSWSGVVTLSAGDNEIRLQVAGNAPETTLRITHNPGYGFGGPLSLSPDIAYAGEPRLVRALVALPDGDTDPTDVRVVRLTSQGEVVIAAMSDDGNLQNGDEIDGDQVYSTQWIVDASSVGAEEYRVTVGTLSSSSTARSEIFELRVAARLDPIVLGTILAQQQSAQVALDDAVAAGDVDAVVDALKAQLAADPLVEQVGESDSGRGLWIAYKSGVAGVLYAAEPGEKGGSSAVSEPRDRRAASVHPADGRAATQVEFYSPRYEGGLPRSTVDAVLAGAAHGALAPTNVIDSNKALVIAAQYWEWGESDDIPAMEQLLTNESCFDVNYVKNTSPGGGSVEHFKGMGNYGVVLVSSHGDSFYNGLLSLWQDKFGWNGPFGQVVIDSDMTVTPANQILYEDDLQKGRLVLWGGTYGILPSFITRYAGAMPNSLVYMSICRGTWNATMAQAFLQRGAGSFLGYSDYVDVPFCEAIGVPLLDTLLDPGKTLADAFTAGQKENDADPAEFILYGAQDLSIEISGLQDGGFESGQILQAWSVIGDARIISGLDVDSPTEGALMGVVSTGLGYTTTSGQLTQEICLDPAATQITFDWNFMSEEFMEWVGSIYQDSFTVTLTEIANPANKAVLLFVYVDSLANQVSPLGVSFDQGDVWGTGWKAFSGAVPAALQGKRVELKFFATDIGDSIYDTAVLVDDVVIQ